MTKGNIEHPVKTQGSMNTQGYDSPLTPALSPLRGEGAGTLPTSLVAEVIRISSVFGGGQLRTASPTTCERTSR